MINEEKLREELGKILERPAYGSLHTFTRQPLIDKIIKAVKECEIAEPEAAAEEQTEAKKPKPSGKGKKSG